MFTVGGACQQRCALTMLLLERPKLYGVMVHSKVNLFVICQMTLFKMM